jgi:hypothetical protein
VKAVARSPKRCHRCAGERHHVVTSEYLYRLAIGTHRKMILPSEYSDLNGPRGHRRTIARSGHILHCRVSADIFLISNERLPSAWMTAAPRDISDQSLGLRLMRGIERHALADEHDRLLFLPGGPARQVFCSQYSKMMGTASEPSRRPECRPS